MFLTQTLHPELKAIVQKYVSEGITNIWTIKVLLHIHVKKKSCLILQAPPQVSIPQIGPFDGVIPIPRNPQNTIFGVASYSKWKKHEESNGKHLVTPHKANRNNL